METLNSIDIYLFRLLNASGFEAMDPIMSLISGTLTWIPLYLLLLYLLYKKNKKQILWTLLSLGVLVFLADFGSVHFFKNVFERLRPCHQLEGIRVVGNCGGLYSFVSSHASNVFAIAFFMGLVFRNIWGFIHLFSWAVLVGFSRIYLGVHFPFDILGGMFWGLTASLIAYQVYKIKIK